MLMLLIKVTVRVCDTRAKTKDRIYLFTKLVLSVLIETLQVVVYIEYYYSRFLSLETSL